MEEDLLRSGSCLCGAVQFTAELDKVDLGVCHCKLCRRWAGGPFFELECGLNVSFLGSENISSYASSSWARRGFCKTCGTHIYIQSTQSGEYGIPPGLFHDDAGFQFNRQVFIDHKPEYYSFANETRDISSAYIYEHYPETRNDT